LVNLIFGLPEQIFVWVFDSYWLAGTVSLNNGENETSYCFLSSDGRLLLALKGNGCCVRPWEDDVSIDLQIKVISMLQP
jgi:hypothetical protein